MLSAENIIAANSSTDHLSIVPNNSYVARTTGDVLQLVYARPDSMGDEVQQAVFQLTERNMREAYERTWGWKPQEKKLEMFSDKSHYLLLFCGSMLVAFSHFQVFIVILADFSLLLD
jgi:hypothetical protein